MTITSKVFLQWECTRTPLGQSTSLWRAQMFFSTDLIKQQLTKPNHFPGAHSPLRALSTLQVEEQRGDDLVHVLRVPDIGLQLIVHSLPHHTLQALDPCHANPSRQQK